MKLTLINTALIASAIILGGANTYLRSNVAAARTMDPGVPIASNSASPAQLQPASPSNTSDTNAPEPQTNAITLASVRWAPLETDQYSHYMENLRRFGFPQELIHQIVIVDIDAMYAPRVDPLKQNRYLLMRQCPSAAANPRRKTSSACANSRESSTSGNRNFNRSASTLPAK